MTTILCIHKSKKYNNTIPILPEGQYKSLPGVKRFDLSFPLLPCLFDFYKIDISSLPLRPEVEFRESRFSDIKPSALWLVEIPSWHGLAQDLVDQDQIAWASKGAAPRAIQTHCLGAHAVSQSTKLRRCTPYTLYSRILALVHCNYVASRR